MDPLYTIGIPLLALIVGLLVGAWFGRRGTAELEWKVQSLQKSLDRQGSDLAAMTAQK